MFPHRLVQEVVGSMGVVKGIVIWLTVCYAPTVLELFRFGVAILGGIVVDSFIYHALYNIIAS